MACGAEAVTIEKRFEVHRRSLDTFIWFSSEMDASQIVGPEPIIELLHRAAPGQSQRLQDLFGRVKPAIYLDHNDGRILFRAALGNPNIIIIGLECTRTLEAYAYVSSVLAIASGFPVGSPERTRLYQLADILLNWAVPRDLREVRPKRNGEERSFDDAMVGSDMELPPEFFSQFDRKARLLGRGFFEFACAFIMLHELAHLELGHSRCVGVGSIDQERDADDFAARWLMDHPSASPARRLNLLFGISAALLWPTISNVYFGVRQSDTHPEAYDRLYRFINQRVDPASDAESLLVWDLIGQILFIHMDRVGFKVDQNGMQGSPRDQANYLIDLLSKQHPSAV